MDIVLRSVTGILVFSGVLLSGCEDTSAEAVTAARNERSQVSEIIVRYEIGAPPTTRAGRPWGAQCVSASYRGDLMLGREIGGRMRVVRIAPPVSAAVASGIAVQLAQCPYIEWAEADTVVFTVS